ncbi:integrase core domain-containing protein [Rheinheimera sp. UJ63]|uniref:integrase core domain-containing protein n=1 Tax=Rheinheimera sp. UJ63 TaxID=2910157 RepID=UPI001F29493A|nr:integrase core domain-containing protein [Rheinheimera sp. UJ63]MCF4009705.1 integrase core domain-containing protein [Rheinheimera sp. UJ63]
MPWNELNLMDNKLLFLADCLRKNEPFSVICERYGISRKTGYKWLNRYKENNEDGLKELSRKPHSHPCETPYSIRKKIEELRTSPMITLGAKKIQRKLQVIYPDVTPPSVTTIHKILTKLGLVEKQHIKKRVPRHTGKLKPSTEPNELWSVDFKGELKMNNGELCYPLTVMDDNSRYLLGCEGQVTNGHKATISTFRRLFNEYGLPERIRSDNGAPFATKGAGGLSTLSMWWIRLGIYPERTQPGRPQQNGKHERMHRTLKKAINLASVSSMSEMQTQFETFKTEYNNERPHESLDLKTPSDCYKPSLRPFPKKLPPLIYPGYYSVKKVMKSGVFYWKNGQAYVSNLLAGEWVGIEEVDEGIYDVFFGFYKLGRFDISTDTNYWTVKL